MQKQPLWVFGHPDFAPDALPLKILPQLQAKLPQFEFMVKDPHEEWQLPQQLIIIDTVMGLKEITTFTSLTDFQETPRLTLHDFDLLTNLKWLAKLNRLPPFLIIGLPMSISPPQAIKKVVSLLQQINSNSPARSAPHNSCTDHKP